MTIRELLEIHRQSTESSTEVWRRAERIRDRIKADNALEDDEEELERLELDEEDERASYHYWNRVMRRAHNKGLVAWSRGRGWVAPADWDPAKDLHIPEDNPLLEWLPRERIMRLRLKEARA